MFRKTGEMLRVIVMDNNEPRSKGHMSIEETKYQSEGEKIRQRLTIKLASHKMGRPMEHDIEYNRNSNVIITGYSSIVKLYF